MEEFVRNRITQLRITKGISEYKMSYDLGHSKSYINNISAGKCMPSLTELFAICDYFGITPAEFFNENPGNPILLSEAINELRQLSDEEISLVIELVRKITSNKK